MKSTLASSCWFMNRREGKRGIVIPSTTPVSMQVIILILLVSIVLYLYVTPRIARESASRKHQHHTHLPEKHSYMYYRDRNGNLQYEEDGCRECIEARAAELRRQGVELAECVLGTRRSRDV